MQTVLARRPLSAWRTVDLLTMALLGVAFGVAFWGYDQVYAALLSGIDFAFKPLSGLWVGPWLLAGVVGGLVIRRPGAALATELVAAAVELTLGNAWGATALISGLLQGLGAELAFALFAYRVYRWPVALLAGALAVPLEWMYEWHAYYSDWALSMQLLRGAFNLTSGLVIAGGGGWLLVRALAGSGVLRAFPPGQGVGESTG